MNIHGWDIDISALTQISSRDEAYCNDYLYESEYTDTACLIHSQFADTKDEYYGWCALYENKSSPKLLFEIKLLVFFPDAFFSNDGNLIFLKGITRYNVRFVLVLNLAEKSYSIVNYSPCSTRYNIFDMGDGLFEIRFDDELLAKLPSLKPFNKYEIDSTKLRFKDWKPLAEGGDLNIQGRGIRYLLSNKNKIWNDSLQKLELGAMSSQFFVDINRSKKFYYINIFKTDKYGHTKMYSMQNDGIEGKYFPVFTTYEKCIEYVQKGDFITPIYKSSLKNIMSMLDKGYPLNQLGIVIDPHDSFVAIPRNIRVTPKSLRY